MIRRNSEKGTSLIEVTFASALLVVVIGTAMILINYSQNYMRTESASAYFHFQTQRSMEEILRPMLICEFRNSWTLAGSATGKASFPIPTGSTALTGTGRIGCIEIGRLNQSAPVATTGSNIGQIQFAVNSIYIRFVKDGTNTISENTAKVGYKDLNLDKDTTDVFDVGYLEYLETTPNANPYPASDTRPWRKLSMSQILLPQTLPTVTDSLFYVDGTAASGIAKLVCINIFFYNPNYKIALRVRDRVAMRNVQ